MELTQGDIAKIAKLSRLSFSDNELVRFTQDLNAILGYASQINEVDLSGSAPFFDVVANQEELRTDEVKRVEGVDAREPFLKNVPERTEEYLKVKSVF